MVSQLTCYLIQVSGDNKFRLTKNSARIGGKKAEFTAAGWVYQSKKDAEEIAQKWSKGARKLSVIPWWDPRPLTIWNSTSVEASLAKKKIRLEIEQDKLNTKKQDIEMQCYTTGLHHSWLWQDVLPDDMSEEEKKIHSYFKPLWDETLHAKNEINLRCEDAEMEAYDFQNGASDELIKSPFSNAYSLAELLQMPKKEWLIDDLLGSRDIGIVYGAPASGKTFIVIDLIMCACLGLPWANRFSINRPLSVAYCAGEGVSGLTARFSSAATKYKIENLPNFYFFTTVPQLFEDSKNPLMPKTNAIVAFIDVWKKLQLVKERDSLDLLIIDTLHTAICGGEENSSKVMGQVLQSCRLVASELGCAVLLVHHTNKEGSSERGSSALRGGADFMVEIKPNKMTCSKLKDGKEWCEQTFGLSKQSGCESVSICWNDQEEKLLLSNGSRYKETLMNEMRKYPKQRFTCKALAEAINQKENYTRNLLTNLVDSGKCKRELKDSNKDSSSKNPWIYFMDETAADFTCIITH